MYIPFNYQQINTAAGLYNPSPVKAYNNQTFAFWERALFQRALSVLDISLPEDWNGSIKDLFNYILFKIGFVIVFNEDKYGTIFTYGSLRGYDVFYRPTNIFFNASPADLFFAPKRNAYLLLIRLMLIALSRVESFSA